MIAKTESMGECHFLHLALATVNTRYILDYSIANVEYARNRLKHTRKVINYLFIKCGCIL